jgi:Protein of unknown function (DUF1501)
MITLLGSPRRCCDGITRRQTLKAGALSFLGGGFTLENLFAAEERRTAIQRPGKAKSVILLYLMGGAATQDMWDLKPEAPVGIKSEFKPIATSAPGVQICEHLPQMARWMHRAALVRSVSHKGGCHNPLPTFTGYEQTGRGTAFDTAANGDPPSMGSVCEYLRQHNPSSARRAGDDYTDYVFMPFWMGRERKPPLRWSGPYAGFLGPRYDPVVTDCDPYGGSEATAKGIFEPVTVRGQPFLPNSTLGADMTVDRLNSRRSLLQQIDEQLRQVDGHQTLAGYDRMQQRAFDVLASTKTAFDLSREDPRRLDRYGRSLFGNSALIARRLVQAGVRFVNVTWDLVERVRDLDPTGWDTHGRNFLTLKGNHLPGLDQTYAALLEDLDRTGLLDETLIVVMSEMGRTPKINAQGGRDHWTNCFSVLLAGAGIKGGTVYGTSDSHAGYVKDHPASPADICATIYHCLGIDPEMTVQDRTGRPVPIAHGGRPIAEIVS